MRKMMYSETLCTPIGKIQVQASETALVRVTRLQDDAMEEHAPNAVTDLAVAQIREYFAGTRRVFTVPVAFHGTPFQCAVWRELQRIPFGCTVSYRELGERMGRPAASRAIGGAVGKNPLLIFVPCHRVIRADGGLGGFSAGLDAKIALLEREGVTGFRIGEAGK